MKTATKVRDLDGFAGDAALYKLSEPLASYDEPENSYEYVVVSSVNSIWAMETYIFGSSETGRISDWAELPGSIRGEYSHDVALNHAGYEVGGGRMTVAELIKKLQQFRPDAKVEIETKGYDGIGNEHSSYIDPFEVAQYCNETKPTVTILGQERS